MYLRRLYDLPVLSVAGTLSITSQIPESICFLLTYCAVWELAASAAVFTQPSKVA
uniref:Uncharacterized protein n=1 Tax=Yersinia pseudotuberculosis serotype O:3 (strain YPIII) TaxID=502800 RepID=A0A0H3B0P6_YERPY